MSFSASITDTQPAVVGSTPTPSSLTPVAIYRGVQFSWSLNTWVRPFYWEYQTQVESEGWLPATPTRTLYPQVTRMLTATELGATGAGANKQIQIRVRGTDGVTPGSWTTSSLTACLSLAIVTGDLVANTILLADLATEVTAKMFVSTDRDAADLKTASVILSKLATAVTDLMFPTSARVAADTTLVNGVAAATVSAGAADGVTAQAKIVASGAGANALEHVVGSQAKVDARLSAADLAKLVDALDVAGLATLDAGDHILITGTHQNIFANRVSIKAVGTGLELSLVDNLAAATIRGALTEANLQSADGVTKGASTNLAASINALSALIESSAIKELAASKVKENTLTTALFDTAGNYTAGAIGGVGIKSGATAITPANIINAIDTSGRAKTLLLTGATYTGTLDDIPQTGTDKAVTANEKLGAAYAYSGLNSSGELTGGTTNFTTGQVEENIDDFYPDHGGHNQSATAAVITGLSIIDVDPSTGVAQLVFEAPVLMRKGTAKFKIRVAAYTDNAANTLTAQVYSELDVVLGTPATSSADVVIGVSPTYAAQTLTVATTPSTTAGNTYMLRLLQTGATASDIKIKVLDIWQEKA